MWCIHKKNRSVSIDRAGYIDKNIYLGARRLCWCKSIRQILFGADLKYAFDIVHGDKSTSKLPACLTLRPTALTWFLARSAARIYKLHAAFRRKNFFGILFLFFVAVFAAPVQSQTLETVRERGFLICAASGSLDGFSKENEDGVWTGFDVDICRAIAAATIGDPDLVEFRLLAGEGRFAQLQSGEIDVLSRNASWTMSRDTRFDVRYSTTSFFDGQSFMVRQEKGFVSAFELTDISVCVVNSSDDLANMRDFFFTNQAVYTELIYEDFQDLVVAYSRGLCDAITAPASFLQAVRRSLPDPGMHRVLPEYISKTPFGPTVRYGDEQWADIVRWTVFTLINAEELGISSLNIDSMLSARTPAIRRILGLEEDFGLALGLEPEWMQNVIRAVGNYRELFERHFGPQTGAAMLRGPNALWSRGGLLYAPPVR